MVCIGAKHILPLFVPQIVHLPDILVPGKLRYNLVDDSLHVRFQITVHLLPRGAGKAVAKLNQQFFNPGIQILPCIDFRHDLRDTFPPLLPQAVTVFRLLLVGKHQLLRKDFFGKGRPHFLHALGTEVSFSRHCGVGNEMDMGVVSLVMISRIPPQMVHWNLEIFGKGRRLSPEEIPPTAPVVEAQPGGIFPFQRQNRRIHIAPVGIQLF